MARLFGDEGQQQQLQVVRRQLASARQPAVVGKAESARTAAPAMVAAGTAGAMPVVRREPCVFVFVVVMMVVMVMMMMMWMVVWHDRPLYRKIHRKIYNQVDTVNHLLTRARYTGPPDNLWRD